MCIETDEKVKRCRFAIRRKIVKLRLIGGRGRSVGVASESVLSRKRVRPVEKESPFLSRRRVRPVEKESLFCPEVQWRLELAHSYRSRSYVLDHA